jgi:ABC-type molybdate transport system ATPase subunit
VRVRVLARDVSLALEAQPGSSIGNQLPATVELIADDEHPALALVSLLSARWMERLRSWRWCSLALWFWLHFGSCVSV